jgi:mannose-6-phosphate isomerase-like protein (cupin superfamily)
MAESRILILGASYGSLVATRLLLAGHRVTLVCTRATADLINCDGTVVRFPIKGREVLLDVASKQLPGTLTAGAPDEVDPAAFELAVLGMQEAQYGAPGVRELMGRLARAAVPCLAIMNMPPLAYLKRIARLQTQALEECYVDPRVWDGFDPALMTLASPDPQAFRPPDQPKNVLQVGLATNFKAARFGAEAPTDLLRRLAADIDAARLGAIELPVKLKVHDSLFVPLAKWPMLIAGNYRSIRPDGMVSIQQAVHADLERSRAIYDWVWDVCRRLGAADADGVPFEKYAQAAAGLGKPSSAARALAGGAPHIERVDCLIRRIAQQQGMRSDALNEIVALVDERLTKNRANAARRAAHVSLADALAKGPPPAGNLAVPIFAHGSLQVEMYTPSGHDMQTPHARDEVYVVARGEGVFCDGDRRHRVGPGSFLFVAAGQPHCFEEFSEDFAVWVFFYGPAGGEAPQS